MLQAILPPRHCTDAQEFFNELSPCGPTFKSDNPNAPWLFRGQGKDAPPLPSALRQRDPLDPHRPTKLEELVGRDLLTSDERAKAETEVILDFFNIADRRGLVLPDDSQQLRQLLWSLRDQKSNRVSGTNLVEALYNPRNTGVLFSLIALAQHYNIPTRLLDWSFRPYSAMYFAAEGAIHSDQSGNLVVWAFYFPVFGKHNWIDSRSDPFTVVTAPSSSNPNLSAQQGVFTLPI